MSKTNRSDPVQLVQHRAAPHAALNWLNEKLHSSINVTLIRSGLIYTHTVTLFAYLRLQVRITNDGSV